MATTFTPTVMTYSTPIAASSIASGTLPGTTVTVDLTTKFGAWLYCRIGRTTTSALTNAAYIAIRRQVNNTLIYPSVNYDFVSSIAAVNSTTISSGGSSSNTSIVLAAGAGFTNRQIICIHSSGARVEFAALIGLSASTVWVDRSVGFRLTHNASDVVSNGADVGNVWIPGGDIWELTPINNSGQTLVFAVDAAVYASDTGT